jgi:hypothetical protein
MPGAPGKAPRSGAEALKPCYPTDKNALVARPAIAIGVSVAWQRRTLTERKCDLERNGAMSAIEAGVGGRNLQSDQTPPPGVFGGDSPRKRIVPSFAICSK